MLSIEVESTHQTTVKGVIIVNRREQKVGVGGERTLDVNIYKFIRGLTEEMHTGMIR